MTSATTERPARQPVDRPDGGRSRRRVDPRRAAAQLGVRRTLYALLAAALGTIPLKGLFYDWGWLFDVWVTMIIVIAPAALLRRRRPPGALDIWPGILLLIPWLTLRFVPTHAIAGVIPTRHTWHDVSALLTNLHHTTRDDVAPIHTTVAVRLVVCALLGLLAALIDLIAVVGHRGALAGVPLLIVYTVAGAVPRRPVSWVWFAFAAMGYLILLGLDAGDDVQSWGRRIHVSRDSRSKSAVSISTPRIAVAAIVVAVILPLLVPGQSRNLLSNAFHHGSGGSGVGGFGAEGGGSISPFAALKGELDQTVSVPMATVNVQALSKDAANSEAFYLRSNVLSKYTGQEWTLDSHGATNSLDAGQLGTEPSSSVDTIPMRARFTVLGLTGNAPIFTVPNTVSGLDGSKTTWSPQDELLLGSTVSRGDQYTEQFNQPDPSHAQLEAATARPPSSLSSLTDLPADFPDFVRTLTDKIIRGANTPYDRARAISDYFTNPQNGFVYALKTDPGDSGSVLVDFLKNKQGYCQQYAASMGVMLRAAGIPSRVVLGYMHDVPDQDGNVTITSSEAHAWVEAYFTGIGWIPFDPTPTGGLVGGSKTDLSWAPHDYPKASTHAQDPQPHQPSVKPVLPTHGLGPSGPKTTATETASRGVSIALIGWLIGAVLVVGLVLVPAMIRALRRRRRYLAARRDGDTDALWAELSDTAVDLGFVWSPARSPRQVATWLGREAFDSAASLQALASAVEYGRYAPTGSVTDTSGLVSGLRSVTGELRANRSRGTRLRAALWPASLGWGSRLRGFGRRYR